MLRSIPKDTNFFGKLLPLPNFWKFHCLSLKKHRNKTTCIYLKFYVITFDSLSMFSLEHFGIFLIFKLPLAMSSTVFCKDFPC